MKKTILVLFSTILVSCSIFKLHENLFVDTFVKENLTYLASDELEGRETATRGEKLASEYIAKKLKEYGIKPFGDDSTYFQNFDLAISGYSNNSKIKFTISNVNYDLVLGEDFVRASWSAPSEKYFGKESDLVFAGYGIEAPEFEYNDYADLDVKGKTVLVLAGEPESDDPDYFNGDEPSKYGSTNSKIKKAMDLGAVGIIFLPDKRMVKFWKRYASWSKSKSMRFPDSKQSTGSMIPAFAVSEEKLNNILSSSGIKLSDIKNYLDDYRRPESFEMNVRVSFNLKFEKEIKTARNVVGILEGVDKDFKREYIVLSAHYDHLGKRGNDIYNGADDDGSGTVTILDAARTLSITNENRRSILFVFHTGEEKGLLGSRYFTEHFDRMDAIKANINIDMVGRGSVDTIYNIGSGKLSQEFYQLVRDANKESVNIYFNYKFDDPDDPNRFYYRSDHINYARKGIPIVFFYDYMQKDYHKPTDTVEKINWAKIVKMVELTHTIALKTANLDAPLIVDQNQ